MSMIDEFKAMQEISFIDNKSVLEIRDELISDYVDFYKTATGETLDLSEASPMRLALYAAAVQIYQALQYIDRGANQSLLPTSYGNFLDTLGALWGLSRTQAKEAVTTERFTLSAVQTAVTAIPKGTRVSASGKTYFATEIYAEIPAGQLYVDVPVKATAAGSFSNGIAVGKVATLVDPIPYIDSVSNLDETSGGSDAESDDDFTRRIYLTPSSFSTAGPEESYEYWVQKFSPEIGDVKVTSNQAAGTVNIVFLMSDGTLPSSSVIAAVKAYISDDTIRPMTDLVTVEAPEEVPYTIDVTYYIASSDINQVASIQSDIALAVLQYQTWQRKIGRDVNPDKLSSLIIAAGAKRCVVATPTRATVESVKVAKLSGTATITYGGLEDD